MGKTIISTGKIRASATSDRLSARVDPLISEDVGALFILLG